MSEEQKRRLRIEGMPDELRGYMLSVYDVDTGEPLTNIVAITVYLRADHTNFARVTYYPEGKVVLEDEKVRKKSVQVDDVEIAVTAFEI